MEIGCTMKKLCVTILFCLMTTLCYADFGSGFVGGMVGGAIGSSNNKVQENVVTEQPIADLYIHWGYITICHAVHKEWFGEVCSSEEKIPYTKYKCPEGSIGKVLYVSGVPTSLLCFERKNNEGM